MPMNTEESLAYQFKVVQHAIRLAMDQKLRQINLTTPQCAALTAIADDPGASGAVLARKCFVTPQTMTEIINNLIRLGLIERRPHAEHGRIIQTYLTAAGQQTLAQAEQRIAIIDDRLSAQLTRDEKKRLLAWLRKCREALDEVSR